MTGSFRINVNVGPTKSMHIVPVVYFLLDIAPGPSCASFKWGPLSMRLGVPCFTSGRPIRAVPTPPCLPSSVACSNSAAVSESRLRRFDAFVFWWMGDGPRFTGLVTGSVRWWGGFFGWEGKPRLPSSMKIATTKEQTCRTLLNASLIKFSKSLYTSSYSVS